MYNQERKLICFSMIYKTPCMFGQECTYAHSLQEQIVDDFKRMVYQIILDRNLKFLPHMPYHIGQRYYENLMIMTRICHACTNHECTGGYNCYNGVFDSSIKLCRNDFLTGDCKNTLCHIDIHESILYKFAHDAIEWCDVYVGCEYGHHLTQRQLIPFYTYHILHTSHEIESDTMLHTHTDHSHCLNIDRKYHEDELTLSNESL